MINNAQPPATAPRLQDLWADARFSNLAFNLALCAERIGGDLDLAVLRTHSITAYS
jgi:hypothetical protein